MRRRQQDGGMYVRLTLRVAVLRRVRNVELAFAAGRDHVVSAPSLRAEQRVARVECSRVEAFDVRRLLRVPGVQRAAAWVARGGRGEVARATRLVHELPREDVR
jgi:hypothetical protein